MSHEGWEERGDAVQGKGGITGTWGEGRVIICPGKEGGDNDQVQRGVMSA